MCVIQTCPGSCATAGLLFIIIILDTSYLAHSSARQILYRLTNIKAYF